MKCTNWTLRSALTSAASLVLVTGVALAAMSVTPWTATETGGAITDHGTVTVTPDGYTLIRGYAREYIRNSTDPRASGGTLQTVMSFNLDPNMTGPMW